LNTKWVKVLLSTGNYSSKEVRVCIADNFIINAWTRKSKEKQQAKWWRGSVWKQNEWKEGTYFLLYRREFPCILYKFIMSGDTIFTMFQTSLIQDLLQQTWEELLCVAVANWTRKGSRFSLFHLFVLLERVQL